MGKIVNIYYKEKPQKIWPKTDNNHRVLTKKDKIGKEFSIIDSGWN